SGRRKTFTISIFFRTSSNEEYAFSPKDSLIIGFTGMILYAWACMYAETAWLARRGLSESPTTAMAVARVRRSRIGFEFGEDDTPLSTREARTYLLLRVSA